MFSGGRFTARFQAEAWSGDNAIEVDPPGPDTWDCTAYALPEISYLNACISRQHATLENGVTDTDDVFKEDPAAPEWVRQWRGPFTITITRQVPQ